MNGQPKLIGTAHVIQETHWIVIKQSLTTLTLKRANNEIHAIRLQLGISQYTISAKLNISQSYYCKLEAEALPMPPEIRTAAQQLLPKV